jgi:hypothetical protein
VSHDIVDEGVVFVLDVRELFPLRYFLKLLVESFHAPLFCVDLADIRDLIEVLRDQRE